MLLLAVVLPTTLYRVDVTELVARIESCAGMLYNRPPLVVILSLERYSSG